MLIRSVLSDERIQNWILLILLILALWAILAVQLRWIPLIPTGISDETTRSINAALLTLSYSYLAALLFHFLTYSLPTKQRKEKLEPIIKRKITEIGRTFNDLFLEFSRETSYGHDVHNTVDTDALLRSKDWTTIVPHFRDIRHISITYLQFLKAVGDNIYFQTSTLIARYQNTMTISQLVALENLLGAKFHKTIAFLYSFPKIYMEGTSYDLPINDFLDFQKQYLKVEKEFGINEMAI